MKVLHIVPSYKPAYIYGGTIEVVARLCEDLVQAGENVTVFTTTANGNTELNVQPNKKYIVDGVDVIYFKRTFKDPFYISIALWKTLYREIGSYDVVHIHSWWNLIVIVALGICKLKKARIILSPHGMLSTYILENSNTIFKELLNATVGKTFLKYAKFCATSTAEYTECKNFISGWNGQVIYNLLWLPALHILKPFNKQFTIIYLSRIHPKKGIELLLEAIAIMNKDVSLIIAGSGDEQYIHQLKEKAVALGIANKIQWPGWLKRDEKFEALMRADLFVLTSYNENFANVVIEALHVGTPVLLTEGVGLSRFVEENDFGWITKPEPAAIKNALETAIADNEKRTRIIETAPCIIKKNFSPSILIPQYQRLYASFLQ